MQNPKVVVQQCCGAGGGGGGGAPGATLFLMEVLMEVEVKKTLVAPPVVPTGTPVRLGIS